MAWLVWTRKSFPKLGRLGSPGRPFSLGRHDHRPADSGPARQFATRTPGPATCQRGGPLGQPTSPVGRPSRVPWFGKRCRSFVPAAALLRADLSPGSRIAAGDRHSRRTASLMPGSGPRNAGLAWDGDAGRLMRQHPSAACHRPRVNVGSRAQAYAPHRGHGCGPIARHRRQEASATWRAR